MESETSERVKWNAPTDPSQAFRYLADNAIRLKWTAILFWPAGFLYGFLATAVWRFFSDHGTPAAYSLIFFFYGIFLSGIWPRVTKANPPLAEQAVNADPAEIKRVVFAIRMLCLGLLPYVLVGVLVVVALISILFDWPLSNHSTKNNPIVEFAILFPAPWFLLFIPLTVARRLLREAGSLAALVAKPTE